jgi:hypothetical protein
MKIVISLLVFLVVLLGVFSMRNSYPVFYDKNGQLIANNVKIYADTVMPSSASGFSINISSAGFSTIKSVTITAQNNTASIASMPFVVIQSVSTSAIVCNILTQNNSTTTILGITVLSGSPMQLAASTTGMVLNVHIEGT